jgi:lipoprotein NlpI
MENYSAAIESFEQALEIDPGFIPAQENRELALEYLSNQSGRPVQ